MGSLQSHGVVATKRQVHLRDFRESESRNSPARSRETAGWRSGDDDNDEARRSRGYDESGLGASGSLVGIRGSGATEKGGPTSPSFDPRHGGSRLTWIMDRSSMCLPKRETLNLKGYGSKN